MKITNLLLIVTTLTGLIACEYAPVTRKDLQNSQDDINKRTIDQANGSKKELEKEIDELKVEPLHVSNDEFTKDLNTLKTSDSFEIEFKDGIKVRYTFEEKSDKSGFSYAYNLSHYGYNFYYLRNDCKAKSAVKSFRENLQNLLAKYQKPFVLYSEKNEDYIENESNTFMLSKKLVSKIKQRIDGLNDLYTKDNYGYSSNPDYCI